MKQKNSILKDMVFVALVLLTFVALGGLASGEAGLLQFGAIMLLCGISARKVLKASYAKAISSNAKYCARKEHNRTHVKAA